MTAGREAAPGFAELGVRAFTTARDEGSYAWHSPEPADAVMTRFEALQAELREAGAPRLASARQVHGSRVLEHHGGWEGWMRAHDADGHFARERGTAMAVTIADCVPVFLAHPSGASALLHSGWRGTEARIVEQGIMAFARAGFAAGDLRLHLGPSICGDCYEVAPDVYARLTGKLVHAPTPVDLRAIIATHARAAGVRAITISDQCTKHHNARWFSHRAGDTGRQLGVLAGTS